MLMKITSQLILLFSLFVTAALGADYQQLPGHGGGLQSDGAAIVVADDFVLAETTEIAGFTWWGGYDNTPTVSDSFLITLYADSGGQPGSLEPAFVVQRTTRTPTGDFVSLGIYSEYLYNATLETPFQAQAGVRYWLSIANPMPAGETWQWELSSSSPSVGAQRFYDGTWHPHAVVGTAFTVPEFAVPEPNSLALVLTAFGIRCFFIRRRSPKIQ